MSIQELREKQGRIDAWRALASGLSEAFAATLPTIVADIQDRTRLKLGFYQHPVNLNPSDSGCRISGDKRWVHIFVCDINAGVDLRSIACTITRTPFGFSHHLNSSEGGESYELKVELPILSLPICITRDPWVTNLWWSGPADNSKLVDAVVDGFERVVRTSEFVLLPSKSSMKVSQKSKGCSLSLLFVVGLSLLSIIGIIFGATAG